MDKIQQLKEMLGLLSRNTVSPEEMATFLKQLVESIRQTKITLSEENSKTAEDLKSAVNNALTTLEEGEIRFKSALETKINDKVGRLEAETKNVLKKALKALSEIQKIEVKDGKDADEEIIIERILAKIVIPEFKETILDGRKEIVEKINTGKKDALKIEAKQIEGIEKLTTNDDFQRGLSIVEQKTSFLINKINNLPPPGGGGTPGGANTQVQFNNAGVFGGDSHFTWNNTSKILEMGTAFATFSHVGSQGGIISTMDGGNAFFVPISGQNINSGDAASTDFILGNDSASDTSFFMDLGINSGGNTDSSYTLMGPNAAYLYNVSGSLVLATASAESIIFGTGGTLAENERMRISPTGYVGINTLGDATSRFQINSEIAGVALVKTMSVQDDVSEEQFAVLAQFNSSVLNARPSFIMSNSGAGGWEDNFLFVAVHGATYPNNYYLTGIPGKSSDAGWCVMMAEGPSVVGLALFTTQDRPVVIGTNNISRIYVDPDGLTGFGTTAPSARVHILSDTEQLRVGVTDAIYWNATTAASTGVTTFNAVGGTTPRFVFSDPVFLASIKAGATQAGAGAGVGEIWKTSAHATLPDNVLLIGV